MAYLVEIDSLSKRFGKTVALDGVSLKLNRGFSYGLVGANGQGKTTLIKHMLGLYRPQAGQVRVFGYDPIAKPVEVLENIGYLSEHRELPGWMTVGQLLRYVAAFHPKWDHAYERELLAILQLDTTKKVRNLSKGMLAQAGLIVAAAHRPELLLLDEPSTGLDAVVRRDILRVTVRAAAENGGTVLFSSHLLDEVELMSDRIVMIDAGRVVIEGDLDELRDSHSVVEFDLRGSAIKEGVEQIVSRFRDAESVQLRSFERLAGGLRMLVSGDVRAIESLLQSDQRIEATGVLRRSSLPDIFVAYAKHGSTLLEEVPENAA